MDAVAFNFVVITEAHRVHLISMHNYGAFARRSVPIQIPHTSLYVKSESRHLNNDISKFRALTVQYSHVRGHMYPIL